MYKKNFEEIFANKKVAMQIAKLDKFFIKLPHLPKKISSFINKIIPWIVLLGAIISLITTVISFLLTILSLIAFDFGLIMNMSGSLLIILLNTLFLMKAFKPLKNGNAVGWIYLFWANILSLMNSIYNIVTRDITGTGQISLTIILTILGFYLLFEVGQFYEFKKKEN